MKHFLLFLLAFTLATSTSVLYAQEGHEHDHEHAMEEKMEPKAMASKEETLERRLKLSKEMHDIWPVRPKVENAIDVVGEQAPQAERTRFKAAMRKAMDFEVLEAKSIETMADIFTAGEIEAMIEFYGSKEGRSVSFKTGDYEAALQPLLLQMIDKALLDTRLGGQ